MLTPPPDPRAKKAKKEAPDPEKLASYMEARKGALGVNKSVYTRDGRYPTGATVNRAINAHANAQDLAVLPAHTKFHQGHIDALRRYREKLGHEPNEKNASERQKAREDRAASEERMRKSGVTRDWRKDDAEAAKESEAKAQAKAEGRPFVHTRTSGQKAKWGPRTTGLVYDESIVNQRRRELKNLEPKKYTDLTHGFIPGGLIPDTAVAVDSHHRMYGGKSIGHMIYSKHGYLQN